MSVNCFTTKKFFLHLKSFVGIKKEKNIGVAVSGGIDSMSLLTLIQKYYSGNIHVITINHNLRKESVDQCLMLKQHLLHRVFKHQIFEWLHKTKIRTGIQEKARIFRYNVLTTYCYNHSIKYLFIAHHKNDIAETLIMNIMRGSGIDGLSTMSYMTLLDRVYLIRPLLIFSKQEILKFALSNKLFFQHDESNYNTDFTRVKIRSFLSKVDITNDIVSKLCTLNMNVRSSRVFLSKYSKEKFYCLCSRGIFGEIIINVEEYLKLDFEIFVRLTHIILRELLNYYIYPINISKLNTVFKAIRVSDFSSITFNKCIIKKHDNNFYFFKESYHICYNQKLEIGKNIWDKRLNIMSNVGNLRTARIDDVILRKITNKSKYMEYSYCTIPIILDNNNNYVIKSCKGVIYSSKFLTTQVQIMLA